MKREFRLVGGNPPYLDGMWQKHLDVMINRSSRYVISINPDPSDRTSKIGEVFRDQMDRNGIQYRVDCSKDFPTVNSGRISGFVMDKSQDAKSDLFRSIESEIRDVFFSAAKKYPKRESIKGYGFKTFRNDHVRDKESSSHPIKFIRGLNQKNGIRLMYSDVHESAYKFTGSWFLINRDFGNKSDDPIAHFSEIEGIFPSGNIIIVRANEGETVNYFRSLYCSTPYLFLFKLIKQGMRDVQSTQFKNLLPHLDITQMWTDEKIYKEIGLSSDQIDFIKREMDSERDESLSIEEYIELHSGEISRDQERVNSTGEVFTPSYRVKDLLDRVDSEVWSDKTADMLEPAVGEGAFITEMLRRKLDNNLTEEEALKTLYGIDIMEDNIKTTRSNLLAMVEDNPENREIIEANIIVGDTLDNQVWRRLINWNDPNDSTESLFE